MKTTLQILIVCIIILFPLSVLAQIEPTDNNGNGFRNISTLDHLRWFSENPDSWNDNFELDNNIDASDTKNWNDGAGWSPIGNNSMKFTGTFDGNGYEIDNLFINRPEENLIGLFGFLGYSKGLVQNIGVVNTNIIGRDNVGGLVGLNNDTGSIINCYITGTIVGSYRVGGLVGLNYGRIMKCFSSGVVFGWENVGGFVGLKVRGIILNSFNSGEVTGKYNVGGLVGRTESGVIINTYNTGVVAGFSNVGGLIGFSTRSQLTKSYNSGALTGENDFVGGLVGYNNSSYISCSFWDVETSELSTSNGGEGKTTEEMKSLSTYIESGWNFDFIWNIDNDYPFIDIDFSYRPIDKNGNGFLNISTLNDLRWLSESGYDLEKDWELDNNIDATETENWNCGEGWLPIFVFHGTLEGNGFEIQNLYINRAKYNWIGLFSSSRGTIQNIGVSNFSIIGGDYVGGLVGLNNGQLINSYSIGSVKGNDNIGGLVGGSIINSKIKNCYSKGIVYGNNYLGGLSGSNYGIIENCYSSAKVDGRDYVGGLVGKFENSTINKSYSTGAVTGHNYVGGLIGNNIYGFLINYCYSSGVVSGNDYVGGLIGENRGLVEFCFSTGSVFGNNYVGGLMGYNTDKVFDSYSRCTVAGSNYVGGLFGEARVYSFYYCYSTGKVSGKKYIGGLVGYNYFLFSSYSFWDVETSWQETSDGGIGKTTAEMKTKSTFTNADWDFEVIWSIHPDINDGYPYLMMNTPTSVREEQPLKQEPHNFNVYPNPFAGSINMEFDLPAEMLINIVMLDNTGNIIKHIYEGIGNYGHNNHNIELTELSSGLYFLILSTESEILTQKVISVR